MYYEDHPPPHFHAVYGGQKATIDIETLAFLKGTLPARAKGLVIEWATLHRDELLQAFQQAAAMETPGKIPPLD
jgi:hypothetical protein